MTLTRIARNLGISVTTVSRALGGYEDVAAATRQRVAAEARRIDYRPNQIARRLRGGRSGAVGVVLPSVPGHFDDPFFLRLLAATGPRLAEVGMDLLVTASPHSAPDELRAYRHLAEERRVDGILFARTRVHDERAAYLIEAGIPFVSHGRTGLAQAHAFVDIDGEAACRDATGRLIGFGHERIGLINASETYMFAHHRRAGWHAALRTAGLAGGPVAHVEPTEENGFLTAKAMIEAEAPPTALLCATDRLAVGALHAAKAAGLRVGEDISIIGYDNLPLATYTDPPLTTIEQSIARAARRMVEMLLALIGGADPAVLREIWPARLIPRSSDGPAPASRTAETRGMPQNHGGGNHVPDRETRP